MSQVDSVYSGNNRSHPILSTKGVRQEISGRSGKPANQQSLASRFGFVDAGKMPFDPSKNDESQRGEPDGICEGFRDTRYRHIRRKWNEPANEIGRGDGTGADWRAFGIRLLQTKLEAHHKIQPALTIGGYGRDNSI